MHIVHDIIGVPKITEKIISDSGILESEFHIAPFPSGYGMTIGNSLRRVCLSSVPGTKVTGIKIKGVTHEYMTLPGIKHSVLEIMLNIKSLIVEKADSGISWIELTKKKAGKVTAKDISTSSDIKIVNPDLLITEIDQDGFELSMEIRVEKNVGYKSLEELKEEEDDVHVLLVDANFSPVLNMSYDVKSARYGDMTDLDELIINLKTNGIITPKEALQFGSDMLTSYFSMFGEEGLQVEGEFISDIKDLLTKEKQAVQQEMTKEDFTPIELIGLSPRTLNALVNGNILSVEQLAKCTEAKLSSIK